MPKKRKFAPGDAVTVSAQSEKTQYRGSGGTVIRYMAESDRPGSLFRDHYQVRLDNGRTAFIAERDLSPAEPRR